MTILGEGLYFKITRLLQIDVKEAKKIVETHPQWEISDDEDDKKADQESESDISSEYEGSNDDDQIVYIFKKCDHLYKVNL